MKHTFEASIVLWDYLYIIESHGTQLQFNAKSNIFLQIFLDSIFQDTGCTYFEQMKQSLAGRGTTPLSSSCASFLLEVLPGAGSHHFFLLAPTKLRNYIRDGSVSKMCTSGGHQCKNVPISGLHVLGHPNHTHISCQQNHNKSPKIHRNMG